MSSTLTILRNRRKGQNDSDARLQRGSRNSLVGCGFSLSLILVFLIFSLVLSYQSLIRDLPSVENIATLLNPRNGDLLQPTRIYDRSGEHLIKVFAPEDAPRRYIPLGAENPQHIPSALAKATIALADPQFWTDSGYHFSGRPSIAQKLISDLLLWREPPSLRRNLREILLSTQLTNQYGKEQILEWYLNSANYGNDAYGAESAAQLYFGKALTELDLAESATLAAVSQIPALNPISAPTAAYQRRQETLYIMEALNLLDSKEADSARRSPFNLPSYTKPKISAPAFVALTLTQLEEFYPRERIERGGLTIITTLDWDLQNDAECALKTQVTRLGGRIPESCKSASLLPTLPIMDILQNPSASAVVIDPVNGQILTAIGETSLTGESSQLSAGKAGSSLIPFVYLTGFTRGLSPASLLWDIPKESSNLQNFDGEFHGPISLRVALANDYLIPMERVLAQMGAENVNQISQSFGLDFNAQSPLEASLSLSDLARAYGVFSAEGILHGQKFDEDLQAVTVLEMRNTANELWLDWSVPKAKPVLSPQLAYLMNDILSDDSARWQSLGTPNALEVGFPAAGKIGRNTDGLEAWTVGYTPQRVVAVWMGADSAFDAEVSAGLWHALLKSASENLSPIGWSAPSGISAIDVCDPSGLLPTRDCPNIVSEVFLNGSEPNQYDNLYRSFDVNRETGYLATVFTPPELVERREYMLVPPEAREWAESSGLATPPSAYDAILASPRLADAQITSPELFADVRGVLEIRGTAAGDGFDYYRVQIGQGLNPQEWIEIENVSGSIHDNLLAVWDTSELSGLYAIQLLVVRKNQRVDIVTTQVSIDNQPPTLKIVYPQDGDVLDYLHNRQIEFQVQASDNLGVDAVEFYLDFQQVGVVTESPYAWTWATSTGYHHLKVIVRDRAGNTIEEIVRFKVAKK